MYDTKSGGHAPSLLLDRLTLRHPQDQDGKQIWELVRSCSPLDENSLYCNLLQCTHFSQTCLLAQQNHKVIGWVSGYRPPRDTGTLFIWQVAVHETARGAGLARAMIERLIDDCSEMGVNHLKTTITSENLGSWALFKSVAKSLDCPFARDEWFQRDTHFGGTHDTEYLVTIGPFGPTASRKL